MNLEIFSIYDSKAEAYQLPFFLHNQAMAIRPFADCVNSSEHQFGRNPSDYTLFHIGTFDDSTCTIQSHTPKSLGNGVEFIRPSDQPDLFERPEPYNGMIGPQDPPLNGADT